MTIYTLGYARWTVEAVQAKVEDLDAVLVDVRQSPQSSKPGFSRSDLQARLDNRYVHFPAFGNVNYKEGPVELADPERGREQIERLDRAPVLTCGCQNPNQCHRSTVATLLSNALGASIEHLRAPGEAGQPTFFENRA